MKRWNQKSYAHKMVAAMQVEIAQAVYEEKAGRDNLFYKQWPDRKQFVRCVAPTLRDYARQVLSEHLGVSRDEDEKELIYEALLLDNTVPNEDRWTH